MKMMILSTVIALLIASPAHASPLTWFFFGTVTGPSEYHGTPIAGHSFELQIFLDTDLVGFHLDGSSEVSFSGGPSMGEVKITGLDPIGLTFSRAAYSTTCKDANANFCQPNTNPALFRGLNVVGVFYDQSAGPFSGSIKFDAPIASLDAVPFHPAPIERHTPSPEFNGLVFRLPDGNGVTVSARVSTFAAPEGGSALLFLTLALMALGFLRLRYKRSVS
jgi:hypothetical protein